MAGTASGGYKARDTMKRRYGADVYQDIGRAGGKARHYKGRGFASDKIGKDGLTGSERASIAGKRGGETKGINHRSKKE